MTYALPRPARALAATAVLVSAATVAAATPAQAAQLKPAQLETVLLTAKELPKGFSKASGAVSGGGTGGVADGLRPVDDCSKQWLDAETGATHVTGNALATFVRGGGAATIVNGATQFASPAGAKAFLAVERALAKKCTTVSYEVGDGVTMTVRYKPLSMPRQGEESLALTTSTVVDDNGEKVPARGATVLIRRGPVVTSINTTVFAGPVPSAQALAVKAAARLQKALKR
ncbi:sensor domain-containing protein [Motilibacter deserti]|uniref:PknH-like extracellular domain-containing protein n=1 Tax=Motilibacter deserti TaxID=2714956 RepID=A0ABX0GZR4_9ACTN|nr:sensor domain-containing protein [Motilibacter deserti]NHC15065.1 hypothetical protein [Motilibacter deserti]